jgi:hypothetical protein
MGISSNVYSAAAKFDNLAGVCQGTGGMRCMPEAFPTNRLALFGYGRRPLPWRRNSARLGVAFRWGWLTLPSGLIRRWWPRCNSTDASPRIGKRGWRGRKALYWRAFNSLLCAFRAPATVLCLAVRQGAPQPRQVSWRGGRGWAADHRGRPTPGMAGTRSGSLGEPPSILQIRGQSCVRRRRVSVRPRCISGWRYAAKTGSVLP